MITRLEICIRKKSEITNLEYKVLMFNIAAVVAIILVLATLSCNQDGWKMREGIYVWFITFNLLRWDLEI